MAARRGACHHHIQGRPAGPTAPEPDKLRYVLIQRVHGWDVWATEGGRREFVEAFQKRGDAQKFLKQLEALSCTTPAGN